MKPAFGTAVDREDLPCLGSHGKGARRRGASFPFEGGTYAPLWGPPLEGLEGERRESASKARRRKGRGEGRKRKKERAKIQKERRKKNILYIYIISKISERKKAI